MPDECMVQEADDEGVTQAFVKPDAIGSKIVEHKGKHLVGAWFELADYRFVICMEDWQAEAWAWQMLEARDAIEVPVTPKGET